MNAPVVVATMLAVVLAGVGWPLARMVGRTPAWALAVTPVAGGLVVSLGVMASVLTRTSLLPWLALAAAVGWAVLARRRRWDLGFHDDDGPGLGVLAVAALVALVPVVLVDLPPVESDARFIWWFHAAWFRGGGSVARDGMAHAAFGPSHSGYPPLVPGLIASVWHLGEAYDREAALRVSQLVTAAFVAAAGFFVTGVLRLPRRPSMVAAALVAAVCWGANARVGLSGFVDLTWAAVLLTAAVVLLAGPTSRRDVLVGAAFAAAAALIKFEGGVASALLVALTFARAGREWRRAVPVAVAVGGVLASWLVVTTVADVPVEDRGEWSSLVRVIDTDSDVHQRVVETLGHLAHELGLLVGLGVVAVLAIVGLSRAAGLRLHQPGLLTLLVLGGAYVLFDAAAVGVASLPLSEYTDSGNYRTVIVVRLLVVIDVLLAAVAAGRALGAVPPARLITTPGDAAEGTRRPTPAAAGAPSP